MAQSHDDASGEQLARIAEEIRVWRDTMLRGEEGIDDVTLAGFVTGELEDAERVKVEARLREAPELAEIVDVVRDVLNDGSWRNETVPGKIHLQPPLLSRLGLQSDRVPGPSTPVITPQDSRKPLRRLSLFTWGVPLALAAGLLVAVFLRTHQHRMNAKMEIAQEELMQSKAPEAIPQVPSTWNLAIYECQLDSHGAIVSRAPLKADGQLRSTEKFQIQVTVGHPSTAFTLLHMSPDGKIAQLYSQTANEEKEGNTITLPSPTETFELDDSSGWETLLLMPGGDPARLLAHVEHVRDDSFAETAVRGSTQIVDKNQLEGLLKRLRDQLDVEAFVFEHLP